jgi:hypothetical protein
MDGVPPARGLRRRWAAIVPLSMVLALGLLLTAYGGIFSHCSNCGPLPPGNQTTCADTCTMDTSAFDLGVVLVVGSIVGLLFVGVMGRTQGRNRDTAR